MRNKDISFTISRWHERVLGAIWGLLGLACIVNQACLGRWNEGVTWLAVLVGTIYVTASIGTLLGRRWARRTLGVLVALAALFFLDMLLMFGVHNNHAGMWAMLAALALSGYTLLFLLLSAVFCYDE